MKIKSKIIWLTALLIGFVVFVSPIILAEEKQAQDSDVLTINSMDEIPALSDTEDNENQVVVIYQNNSSTNLKSLGLTSSEVISGKSISERVDVLQIDENVDLETFIEELRKNEEVLAVDKNSVHTLSDLPNDPYIKNGLAWQFSNVGANATWNTVNNPTPVVIAVLDTGVNVNHPDLAGRLVQGYDYVTKSTHVVDTQGHGTSVSGVIAAVANNGIGIAGIAGNADIKIAPYRLSSYERILTSNIVAALMNCADRSDVKVINMSFGGYEFNQAEKEAIDYAHKKGKILVAASGNEGDVYGYAGEYSYPASFDNVISVAATNTKNQVTKFSQYNDRVDLAAPGEYVYTTSKDGGYKSISGTSFSSPIVAAGCAVLLASNPNMSAAAVEQQLKDTAFDLGPSGKDNYSGYGIMQLNKALSNNPSPGIPTIPDLPDVPDVPLETININIPAISMAAGKKSNLLVSYSPVNTTESKNVTWSSSNNSIASVSPEGEVIGKRKGVAVITAKVGSLSTSSTVTVVNSLDVICSYQTHVENIGWQDLKENGELSGTSGRSLRLEAIKMQLDKDPANLGISYRTHVENIGWQGFVNDGALSGTWGRSLRLEAIEIKLTGKNAENYDIYYRVHAQNFGWLDWAKNGDSAGTAGYGYRLEAIEVQILPVGSQAPGSVQRSFVQK